MSGQHHADRAKKKPGDLRAETSARDGITAREQGICRKEGFEAARRFFIALPWIRESGYVKDIDHAVLVERDRRWPDATG